MHETLPCDLALQVGAKLAKRIWGHRQNTAGDFQLRTMEITPGQFRSRESGYAQKRPYP